MGLLSFILSAALLAFTSRIVARKFDDAAERFWIYIAASVGQIGTISLALSLIDSFAPGPFLIAQCAVAALMSLLLRSKRKCLPEQPPLIALFRSATATIVRSPSMLVLTLALIAFIASTAIEQFMLPVFDFDDRMYHASRAGYWIQHRSLLAWTTHNDRQIAFPLTGELMFGWPLMMTRWEPISRFVFWLAYPLNTIGIYLSLRALNQATRIAAIGALIFCATPIVLYHTQTVHPDLWLALFSVGAAFWATRAYSSPLKGERLGEGFRAIDVSERSKSTAQNPSPQPFPLSGERGRERAMLMLGLFASMAVSTRAIALPLLLTVPLIAFAARLRLRAALTAMMGIALGLLISGSLGVFVQNHMRDGTPLGSPQMRATHASDLSARQLYTHAVRAILTLSDLPLAPTESIQRASDHAKTTLASALGVAAPLPRESPGLWPGPHTFQTPPRSAGLSIAGWLVLPALLGGLWFFARDRRFTAISIVTLLVIPFWLATIFAIRWMDGMPRFWIGPFAMTLLIIVPLAAQFARRASWAHKFCIALLVVMVAPSLYDLWMTFRASQPDRQPPAWIFDDLQEPLAHIPDGSCILLIAHADARDYALFRPERGLVNRVMSWGKKPFDRWWFRTIDLAHSPITNVLIQDDHAVNLYWDGKLSTGPFVAAMRQHPGFEEILLRTPGMRLFSRRLDPTPPPR